MQQEVNPPAQQPEQQPEEEGKKRYYTPQEVMKKKGCIGCGGMVLAVLVLALVLAIAIL